MGLTVVIDTIIETGNFPDWSMGFKRVCADDLSRLEGYLNLYNQDQMARISKTISGSVITLINTEGIAAVGNLSIALKEILEIEDYLALLATPYNDFQLFEN